MADQRRESVRVFENDFLESLTHVNPIIPLVMWTPITLFLLYRSAFVKGLGLLEHVLVFIIAMIAWTLTEYLLHRFVFHFPAKSKLGKRIMFMIHGLHHEDPDDSTRLVMPPAPGIILGLILYYLFSMIVPELYIDAFMAFFFVGYLIYDYTHYGIHHFKMTSKFARIVKKHHLQHHTKLREDQQFGVSSPLWDYVFRTNEPEPKKSKL